MSTHHSFRCNTCDEQSDSDLNNGLDQLREIVSVSTQIKALLDLGWDETEFANGRCQRLGDLPHFAVQHAEHELVIRDEYGVDHWAEPSLPEPGPRYEDGTRVILFNTPGTVLSTCLSNLFTHLGKLYEPVAHVQLDEVEGPNGVYAVPTRDLKRLKESA